MDSFNQKVERINTAKEAIKTSLTNKGLEPSNNIEDYAALIDSIEQGSGSGDVKLFESVEEMNANTSAKEDDLALIYCKQTSYITPKAKFYDIYFPTQIVLSKAVTEEIIINVDILCDHGGGGDNPTITPEGVSFMFHMNTSSAYIAYESSDGITYTRTTASVDNYEDYGDQYAWEDDVLSIKPSSEYSDGYYMSYYVTSGDTDIAKEFFRRNIYNLKGLYQYQGLADSNKVEMIKNITLNTNNSDSIYDWTVTGESSYDQLYDTFDIIRTKLKTYYSDAYYSLIEKISDTEFNVYVQGIEIKSNGTTNVWSAKFVNLYNLNESLDLRIGYSYSSSDSYRNFLDLKAYKVNTETSTITDITSSFTLVTKAISSTQTLHYFEEPIDKTHYFTSLYYVGLSVEDISVLTPTETSVSSYTNMDISLGYGKSFSYQPAQTQFSLDNTNQIMEGVIALGKDGEYKGDGSIWDSITYEQYMNNQDIDLREGVIYAALADDNTIVDTPCETTLQSLQYVQCKKIDQKFANYYLIAKTDLIHVWYGPAVYKLKICDKDDNELYEYESSSTYLNMSYNAVKQYVLDGILYLFIHNRIYKITETEVSVIYTSSQTYNRVLFTDNCIYLVCPSTTSLKVDIKKITYTGTETTLTSWTRAGGTYYGDGCMEIEDGYLYVTAFPTNNNYGYLGIINITDDTVTCSKAYSLQSWLIRDIHTNKLLFAQYSNATTAVYTMATDGTLTAYGTINNTLYNSDVTKGYFVSELNNIVGLGIFNGISSFHSSTSTYISHFNLGYIISGDTDQDCYYQILQDISVENNIIKANFIYYNSILNLNYECTYTIDINKSFGQIDKGNLFAINGTESSGRYRKVNIFPTV